MCRGDREIRGALLLYPNMHGLPAHHDMHSVPQLPYLTQISVGTAASLTVMLITGCGSPWGPLRGLNPRPGSILELQARTLTLEGTQVRPTDRPFRGGLSGRDGEAGQAGVHSPRPGPRVLRTGAAQDRGLGGESPYTPRNPSYTSAVHTPPPNRARAAPWPSSSKPLLTAALIPGPNWPSTPAWNTA